MGLITGTLGAMAHGLEKMGGYNEPFVNLSDSSSWRLEKRVKEHMAKGYVLVDGIHRDRDWVFRCSMQLDPAIAQKLQAEAEAKRQRDKEAWDATKKKAWELTKKAAKKAKEAYDTSRATASNETDEKISNKISKTSKTVNKATNKSTSKSAKKQQKMN